MIGLGALMVVWLLLLVLYMVLYSEGLKSNQTHALVATLGFGVNLQCNRAMQLVMRCICGCVRCVMDGEARERAAAICSKVSRVACECGLTRSWGGRVRLLGEARASWGPC